MRTLEFDPSPILRINCYNSQSSCHLLLRRTITLTSNYFIKTLNFLLHDFIQNFCKLYNIIILQIQTCISFVYSLRLLFKNSHHNSKISCNIIHLNIEISTFKKSYILSLDVKIFKISKFIYIDYS